MRVRIHNHVYDADPQRGSVHDAGARTVYNKLLGGWYNVTGPHQSPIGGRYNSEAEAKAALKYAQERRNGKGDATYRSWTIFSNGKQVGSAMGETEKEAIENWEDFATKHNKPVVGLKAVPKDKGADSATRDWSVEYTRPWEEQGRRMSFYTEQGAREFRAAMKRKGYVTSLLDPRGAEIESDSARAGA